MSETTAGGPPWPGGAAWMNGQYRPIEAATISVLDLGVTRSDGTYDVVHVWDGRFSRGRMPPGSRDLRTARPTFYCYAVPFIWLRTPEQQQAGASLWISDLVRIPPASVDPRVKNYR